MIVDLESRLKAIVQEAQDLIYIATYENQTDVVCVLATWVSTLVPSALPGYVLDTFATTRTDTNERVDRITFPTTLFLSVKNGDDALLSINAVLHPPQYPYDVSLR